MMRAFIKKLVHLQIRDILVLNYERLSINFHNFANDPPILIYQMGKVGSKSIQSSLQNAQMIYPICNVHLLSKEWDKRAE